MDAQSCNRRLQTRGETFHPPSASAAALRLFPGESWECGADRMAIIELEAAEVLASLACSAMREGKTTGADSVRREVKRRSQRVKAESPAVDSGMKRVHSVPGSSDLVEDSTEVVQQPCEKMCNVMPKTINSEQDAELPNPSSICTTNDLLCGSNKLRQNLTEAEKEARRLRRVLANRESARQTIRRRQALYEELSKKAADLSWENMNLKRKRELAIKEYTSLKTTNDCLKTQVTKSVKVEVKETQEESKSTRVETSTSSSNCPFLIHKPPPFVRLLWPSVMQSPNTFQVHCGSPCVTDVLLKFSKPAMLKPDSLHKQENFLGINSPESPLYILPYSLFFPLGDNANILQPHPSLDMNDKQDGTSSSSKCCVSSSKTRAHVGSQLLSSPIKVENEASNLIEAIPVNVLQDATSRFLPGGSGQHVGSYPRSVFLAPAPFTSIRPPVAVKDEIVHQPDYIPNLKATVSALPETNQQPLISRSVLSKKSRRSIVGLTKKLVASSAAAEARKRRKELTKLKNLQCRQFRMQC